MYEVCDAHATWMHRALIEKGRREKEAIDRASGSLSDQSDRFRSKAEYSIAVKFVGKAVAERVTENETEQEAES